MHSHFVEQGFESILRERQTKNPQPLAEGLSFGAPGGIRTPDQVVRSHLLYPAELRVRNYANYFSFITFKLLSIFQLVATYSRS